MRRSAAFAASVVLAVTGLSGLSSTTAEAEGPLVFSNTTPIVVDGDFTSGTATPYPSTVSVSGVTDPVTSVKVTLHQYFLHFPKDSDVLLVGPTGVAVMLMSDVSRTEVTQPIELSFAADGQPFPTTPGVTPITSGTYLPKDEAELPGTDAGEPPAPAPTIYTTDLTTFNGVDPNGEWELYVFQDVGIGPAAQQIGGGWSIELNGTGGECPVQRSASQRDECEREYVVSYRVDTFQFPTRVGGSRKEELVGVQAGMKGKTEKTADLLDQKVHWRGTLVVVAETTSKDDTTVIYLSGRANLFALSGQVEMTGPAIVHRSDLKGCRKGAGAKVAFDSNPRGKDQFAVVYCGRKLNWNHKPTNAFKVRASVREVK